MRYSPVEKDFDWHTIWQFVYEKTFIHQYLLYKNKINGLLIPVNPNSISYYVIEQKVIIKLLSSRISILKNVCHLPSK